MLLLTATIGTLAAYAAAATLGWLFQRRHCAKCGGAHSVWTNDWTATMAKRALGIAIKSGMDFEGPGNFRGVEKKLVCSSCGADWDSKPVGCLGCLHSLAVAAFLVCLCLGIPLGVLSGFATR